MFNSTALIKSLCVNITSIYIPRDWRLCNYTFGHFGQISFSLVLKYNFHNRLNLILSNMLQILFGKRDER